MRPPLIERPSAKICADTFPESVIAIAIQVPARTLEPNLCRTL